MICASTHFNADSQSVLYSTIRFFTVLHLDSATKISDFNSKNFTLRILEPAKIGLISLFTTPKNLKWPQKWAHFASSASLHFISNLNKILQLFT
jgi:hypothetical protein